MADLYHVSRPTVYKILARPTGQISHRTGGRQRDFTIHKSTNARFRTLQWGLRRLAKREKALEEKLKKEAKRYKQMTGGTK